MSEAHRIHRTLADQADLILSLRVRLAVAQAFNELHRHTITELRADINALLDERMTQQ